MKMNRTKKIQIARLAIQVLMFFLLPGLYIMAFSELKDIIKMVFSGDFNFIQAVPSLLELIIVTVATVLMGRVFCGWLCAFGAYNDVIYLISKKLFKTKFRIDEKTDSYLKYLKYVILLGILFIGGVLGSTVLSSASPWDVFAQITDFSNIVKALPLGFAFLLLITAGAAFVERFFCRYLCPLGAFFNIISRFSLFKIRKPSEKCGNCRICTNNCSMGLSMYKNEEIRGGDCIYCLKCIEACPRKNTHVNAFGKDLNPAVGSSVAIAAFAGIYGISNLGGYIIELNNTAAGISTTAGSLSASTQKYKDGTYTGSGTGFRGGTTTVKLTISGGKITGITTVSTQDTPKFYNRVFNTETQKIISAQTTDIDTVSGATYSCVGIIDAVQNALDKALVNSAVDKAIGSSSSASQNGTASGNTSTTKSSSESGTGTAASKSSTSSASPSQSTNQTTAQSVTYKDGTYTGSGTGFKGGTTKMSVTVSGGKITSIETLSTRDTPSFYSRCESNIINKILSKQSTNVDTLSGATYSSNGIISAVKNALSSAV